MNAAARGLLLGPGLALGLALLATPRLAAAQELRGHVDAEYRFFPSDPAGQQAANHHVSLAIEPQLDAALASGDNGETSLRFTPFLRLDARDGKRTHADIRELYVQHVSGKLELTAGINTLFWGVTETAHLVNVVNQADLVESPDEEELLGQPMLRATLTTDIGTFTAMALPFFRPRSFAGRDGRPQGGRVSNEERIAGHGKNQLSAAVRWSHSIGVWDIGLSHFYGIDRQPRFEPGLVDGKGRAIPVYDKVHRTGIDIQATLDPWLFKFEGIYRRQLGPLPGRTDEVFAAVGGFEYTFFDISGSGIDIGLIGEYLYDERADAVGDNDLAFGTRLSFNDVQSTDFVAAFGRDLEDGSSFYYVEANRRLGESIKLSLEARGTASLARRNPLAALDGEDFVQLTLGWYF